MYFSGKTANHHW